MNFICPTCKRPTQLDNEMIEHLAKEKDRYKDILGKRTKELERTEKQLEIATKCINWVIDTFQKGLEHEADVVGCCELSMWNIQELDQKD